MLTRTGDVQVSGTTIKSVDDSLTMDASFLSLWMQTRTVFQVVQGLALLPQDIFSLSASVVASQAARTETHVRTVDEFSPVELHSSSHFDGIATLCHY